MLLPLNFWRSVNRSFQMLLLSALFYGCSSAGQTLPIIEGGASDYVIVLPANADETIDKAGRELQHYLSLISGFQLPLTSRPEAAAKAIRLGFSPVADDTLGEHQILLRAEGDDLLITGGSPQSVLYAVYTFLEEIAGCRWYAPDAEEVPAAAGLAIPKNFNYSYSPDITTRTVHSRLFYDHPEFADKLKVTYDAFPGYVPEARVHTFHRFLPASVYYEKHPEYYALRDGRRLPTQLCLTNAEVLRIVKDSVAALLERHPEALVISVSQDDNQQHCQCAGCRAIDEREGSPAGSMIAFVNEVAAAFPGTLISTLAYQYTRRAPRELRPAGNVLITLCSIECDRSGPIAEKCSDFTADLVAWGAKTGNVRIWDYTTQFTNFLAPFPNLRTLQPNVQLFRDNNARWVFEQHSYNPSELFELRSYLTAKLLWDPDVDLDLVINDFLTGYYGPAAPFIRNYITTIHDELEKDPGFFLFLYGDPSQAFESYLRPELLARYDQWYDQAEAAVADQPAFLERVRAARLSVDYAILEAARQNRPGRFALMAPDEAGQPATPAPLRARLDRFRETCRRQEITLMNEMRFTVAEYLDQYERTLEKAARANIAAGKPVTLLTQPKKYANEDPQTLTDGALGGSSFFANWLGFVGNDMEAVIDLGEEQMIRGVATDFLQVTNHLVFFPLSVTYYSSTDGQQYRKLGTITNPKPLTRESKVNDVESFQLQFSPLRARYLKVVADNMDTAPVWHHGAGQPVWIFADEVMVMGE